MPYVDPNTAGNPTPGGTLPAAFLDYVRDDLEHLARNAPYCSVYAVSNSSIANNTQTAINFDGEREDASGMHTSGAPSRVTITENGVYLLTGQIEWAAVNTTGVRQAGIRINGTLFIGVQQIPALNAIQEISVTRIRRMVAGDYAELVVYQTSGGGLNVNAAAEYSPEFQVIEMRPV